MIKHTKLYAYPTTDEIHRIKRRILIREGEILDRKIKIAKRETEWAKSKLFFVSVISFIGITIAAAVFYGVVLLSKWLWLL